VHVDQSTEQSLDLRVLTDRIEFEFSFFEEKFVSNLDFLLLAVSLTINARFLYPNCKKRI